MPENDKVPRGVADPAGIRDHLESLDAAMLALMAVRTRVVDQAQDAFSDLNTTAQLFREVFFGVKLPVNTPEELVQKAAIHSILTKMFTYALDLELIARNPVKKQFAPKLEKTEKPALTEQQLVELQRTAEVLAAGIFVQPEAPGIVH